MSNALCVTALAVQMTANTLTGVVTQGVNCPMIIGDDGEHYSLSSLPADVRMGDRLIVEQDPEPAPFFGVCDQGQHINWVRMTRPAADGLPEMSWTNTEY